MRNRTGHDSDGKYEKMCLLKRNREMTVAEGHRRTTTAASRKDIRLISERHLRCIVGEQK